MQMSTQVHFLSPVIWLHRGLSGVHHSHCTAPNSCLHKRYASRDTFCNNLRHWCTKYSVPTAFASQTKKDAVRQAVITIGAPPPLPDDEWDEDDTEGKDTKSKLGALRQKGADAVDRLCTEPVLSGLFDTRSFQFSYDCGLLVFHCDSQRARNWRR